MSLDFTGYLMHALDKNLGFRLFVNYNMSNGKGKIPIIHPILTM